jgi:thiamine-monophosphate kinase
MASMGLASLRGALRLAPSLKVKCIKALETPIPKVLIGSHLSRYANSCIDISDGLIQDLKHILKSSKAGANLLLNEIPCDPFIHASKKYQFALNGGDDYELLFTAPRKHRLAIEKIAKKTNTAINIIGVITRNKSLKVMDQKGKSISFSQKGFDHFA